MDLDFFWHLPAMLRDVAIAPHLSADAQIYLSCTNCSSEARIEAVLLSAFSKHLVDDTCRNCGESGMAVVRHLDRRIYDCHDCQAHFATLTTPFMRDRCQACDSSKLSLISSMIDPPFPVHFDEFFVAKEHGWGILAAEDCDYIIESLQAVNYLPDFPLHLLVSILFVRRLRDWCDYADKHDFLMLLNLEGNLYRDYFRRSGEITAGIKAISIFEECVDEGQDSVNRALMEHNVSMAIYSLLSRYDESLIGQLTSRSDLRHVGIKAAERALNVFESLGSKGESGAGIQSLSRESISQQCARIHHVIGDLLRVGRTSDVELADALRHLNHALSLHVLDTSFAIAVRESRGSVIVRMKSVGKEQIAQAITDIEFVLSREEVGRAWSDKMKPFANLSVLLEARGDLGRAIQYAEAAVAIALDEMDMVIDETVLRQKASQYILAFEHLAKLYGRNSKLEAALSVLEACRAKTVRIHTMSDCDKQALEDRAGRRIVETGLVHLLGTSSTQTKPKRLKLDPILPRIRGLIDYCESRETVLISLGISHGVVTALVLGKKNLWGKGLKMQQWQIDEVALVENLRNYFAPGPSTGQELSLQQICETCWKTLLEPLLPVLSTQRVRTVGLAAAAVLAQLPFEAFRPPNAYNEFATSPISFFYLPSFSVGEDLVTRSKPSNNGNLLVIGYGDTDLPAAFEEVAALKEIFQDRITILDTSECSKRQVLQAMQEPYAYIHFTCHGSFDELVPLNSALHLVGDPENDSHRITARELLEVRFPDFPLVTMSACSTALIGVDASNNYAGLNGSLLRAGARCVIGSRWPVYDEAAAAFMSLLYRKLAVGTERPMESFAATQREMMTRSIEDWAAFAYVGLP